MKKRLSELFFSSLATFRKRNGPSGWKTAERQIRWYCKIPYPILLPLSISGFLMGGAVQAQKEFLTVFQEDFSHCTNAWNSSKAAVSTNPCLKFSGKVYSSRKCVKMASSSLSGMISISLPPSEEKLSDIRLILRGARFDREKPSRIHVLSYGNRIDTLHFSSFFKDKDSDPYSENDSMTQPGKDFSSCDTLSIPITGSFPPERISIQSDADDQCFVDQIKIEYRYASHPDCDLPTGLWTEPHPVLSAWLRLYWKESTECFFSQRIIRIDSGGKSCREFFLEPGEKPEIDLKDLHEGGIYRARAGRLCTDGLLHFSEAIEFRFPDKNQSMLVEPLNDTIVFKGEPGDFLQERLLLKGKNIDQTLIFGTSGSPDLYCFPSRIEPADWKSDTFQIEIGYVFSHFPLSGRIRIRTENPESVLFDIPAISARRNENPEKLIIVEPATGQIYREGDVRFSFLTENFVPGKDGNIAIQMNDSTFYTKGNNYVPSCQSPGFHSVLFFLTDPGKNPIKHTLQSRTYMTEAIPDTVFPQPDSIGCPPPLFPEVLDTKPSSVLLSWVHDAPGFLVEIRDLFGFGSVIHTDQSEIVLEHLQQGNLYAWKVAAICANRDTSDWSQGPDFETPIQATPTENPTIRKIETYPNPCRNRCFIETNTDLFIELHSPSGRLLLKKRITRGKSSIRIPKAGVYFLHLRTSSGEYISRKIIAL